MIGAALGLGHRLRPRVLQEAVRKLLLGGGHGAVEYIAAPRHGHAVADGDVFRGERLQKGEPAGAVRDGVEYLHGDPPVIAAHAECEAPVFAEPHPRAGVLHVVLYLGSSVKPVEIIPKEPAAQAHREIGEPRHGLEKRPLQHLAVYRLVERDRNAEQRVPALRHGGGIDLRRVVEGHPAPPDPLFL